jgi:hypothetical protein
MVNNAYLIISPAGPESLFLATPFSGECNMYVSFYLRVSDIVACNSYVIALIQSFSVVSLMKFSGTVK